MNDYTSPQIEHSYRKAVGGVRGIALTLPRRYHRSGPETVGVSGQWCPAESQSL
jgi:hypothetical protein